MINKINEKKIVGAKQTLKAINNDNAKAVYVARDAEIRVTKSVIEACKQHNLDIIYIDSMRILGEMCSIDVGAAIACVVKNS